MNCSAFNGSKIPSQGTFCLITSGLRVSIPSGAGFPASGGNFIFPFRTSNLNNCNLHCTFILWGVVDS